MEAAVAAPRNKKKTRIFAVVGAVAFLGLAVGGWHWWTVGRFFQSTNDAYVQSDISIVSAKVQGYVENLLVVDNQHVKAGDPLLVLEQRDYKAAVAKARGEIAQAEAAIANAQSRATLQASLIRQAEAQMASAEADRRRTKLDYDRFTALQKNDFVSRQRFEASEADYRKAEASTLSTQAALAAARQQLGVIESERASAEAQFTQARAALEVAEENLENTVLRAPVDGVVGNKGVQAGQFVRVGAQLLSVVPLPDVYVVANFKETQLARIRQGQSVDIAIDAYPNVTLHGTVESFAPASGAQFSLLPPENATGNFTKVVQRVPVRIAVPSDNPLAGTLRPGLSVVVSVDTRSQGDSQQAGGIVGAVHAATPKSTATASNPPVRHP